MLRNLLLVMALLFNYKNLKSFNIIAKQEP